MVRYNEPGGVVSKDFNTISTASTVSEWVDAFNNNAVAGEYINTYLGDMLFNGMLYDPDNIPTIGGVPIASLTNIDLTTTGVSPDSLELDNFFLYFRDINKIIALDHVTFDITDYADGEPHLFYIDSRLGFRVSQEFDQHDDELCLFRFIVKTDLTFLQCYVTSQRFGTSVYDAAGEYFVVQGCKPLPLVDKHLKLDNGLIKRSGIKFDYHLSPDLYVVEDKDIPYNIRYITATNTVDYSVLPTTTVIDNKVLDYSTNTLTTISTGFTVQRILYDVYSDCLVIQYGDTAFASMDEALASVDNTTYAFPYDVTYKPMFIPLGVMFIKAGCTDLRDTEQCLIVQQTSITINPGQSMFFAEDAYARGKIEAIEDQISAAIAAATAASNGLINHLNGSNQNHPITATSLGLGNVTNLSYADIKNELQKPQGDPTSSYGGGLGDYWLKKNVNETTTGGLEVQGTLKSPTIVTSSNYITFNWTNNSSTRLYIGVKPNDAPDGSWAITLN